MSNPSGLIPVEYKVVVKPERVEDTDEAISAVREAGLYVPDEMLEREQMSQVKAVVVALGGNAFDHWNPPLPKVGDTILMSKHSGYVNQGTDGDEYRLINDKDIVAITEMSDE